MATVFLEARQQALDILEIEARCNRLSNELQARGAPILETPRSTRAAAIADAVDMLLLRRMITEEGGRLVAVPQETALLRYYANAIAHWRSST